MKTEKITAAAIKFSNGKIVSDATDTHGGIANGLLESGKFSENDFHDIEDGFLTNRGRFVSREEAHIIALTCKQVKQTDLDEAYLQEYGGEVPKGYLDAAAFYNAKIS